MAAYARRGGFLVTETSPEDVHHGRHPGDRCRRDDRVAEVDVERRRLCHEEPAELVRRLRDPDPPVVSGDHRLPGLDQKSVDNFVEKVVLVRDVAIERHRGDPEIGGKAAHRELVVTSGGNDVDGGFDDLLAGDRSPGGTVPLGGPTLPGRPLRSGGACHTLSVGGMLRRDTRDGYDA